MTLTAKITQSDIVDIIAKHFGVEPKAVALTVNRGWDGGPTDSQAPYVIGEVALPERPTSGRT